PNFGGHFSLDCILSWNRVEVPSLAWRAEGESPLYFPRISHALNVSLPKEASEAGTHAGGVFATTHWSVVLSAGDSASPEAALALERLCRSYWFPLYGFVRRKGHAHEDACDLTQAFFARFLEKRGVRAADAD